MVEILVNGVFCGEPESHEVAQVGIFDDFDSLVIQVEQVVFYLVKDTLDIGSADLLLLTLFLLFTVIATRLIF